MSAFLILLCAGLTGVTPQLAPVSASGAHVLFARWGTEGDWSDVTPHVHKLLAGEGELVLPAREEEIQELGFPDPAPSKRKTLAIVYAVEGKVGLCMVEMGGRFALPSSKPVRALTKKVDPRPLRYVDKLGSGGIEFHLRSEVVALPLQPRPQEVHHYIYPVYTAGDRREGPVEGFMRIDGKPFRLTMASDNEEVLELYQIDRGSAWVFSFKRPGDAVVTITIGRRQWKIPLKVVECPVRPGMVARDLIDTLGLPLGNAAAVTGTSHWQYAAFPSMHITMRQSRLENFTIYSGNQALAGRTGGVRTVKAEATVLEKD